VGKKPTLYVGVAVVILTMYGRNVVLPADMVIQLRQGSIAGTRKNEQSF